MLVLAFSITSVTANVGLPLIFLIVMLETGCGIPFAPGELAVVSGGIEAASHHLGLGWVIVVAAAGAIVGDNIGYLVGRKGGRKVLEVPGPFRRQRRRGLELADPFFLKHGSKAVFLGRWLPFLRVFASWFAGGARMPYRSFVFWNAAGGITWAASVALLGYGFGKTGQTILTDVGTFGLIAMVLAAIVAYVIHRRHQGGVIDGLAVVSGDAAAAVAAEVVLSQRPVDDQRTVLRPWSPSGEGPATREPPP